LGAKGDPHEGVSLKCRWITTKERFSNESVYTATAKGISINLTDYALNPSERDALIGQQTGPHT